ncbi:MAG: hypothetical protein E6429_11960, partial [Staphylococcus sp.]|nr:hypothetical protein [Staphylococcus sp.]
ELRKSIELSDTTIEIRKKIVHWEIATVRGEKNKTDYILTSLIERTSRLYIVLRCASSCSSDVKEIWLSTFKKIWS